MADFQAAIDLSGNAARICVADSNGKVLRNGILPMKRRESAHLAEFAAGELAVFLLCCGIFRVALCHVKLMLCASAGAFYGNAGGEGKAADVRCQIFKMFWKHKNLFYLI